MKNFGKWVVEMRIPILIISFVLLIPSFFGYVGTRVNYDILSYLPKDIETMVGQDILVEEFGTGAFSMFMVEGMKPKETAALKEKIMWRKSSGTIRRWTYRCRWSCCRKTYIQLLTAVTVR